MAKREYSGSARTTALSGQLTAGATTINVVDGTGYPTGASAPFVVTIDAGFAAEEKVLCARRVGNSLTVATAGRGWDGTTAGDHDNAATVAHTFSATDAREANDHINGALDPHPEYLTATEGAVLYASGSHTHPAQVIPTKTYRLPLVCNIPGSLVAGSGTSVIVPAPAGQTTVLTKVVYRLAGGSATVQVLRGGTPITGFTTPQPVTATFPGTVVDIADVTVADNDEISVSVSTSTSAVGLICSVYLDVTA